MRHAFERIRFGRSALRAALGPSAERDRPFTPASKLAGDPDLGTRLFMARVNACPSELWNFWGDGRERSRVRAMPTSQNRDMGHPVLWLGFIVRRWHVLLSTCPLRAYDWH